MLVVNEKKKKTLAIQVVICFALIILSVAFSFMPLAKINLKTADSKSDFASQANEMFDRNIGLGEIPDSVNITAIKSVKSIKLIIQLVKGTKDAASTGDTSSLEKTVLDSNGNVKEDVKETVIVAVALAGAIVGDSLNGDSSSSNLGMVLILIARVLAVLYIVIFSIVVPIVYLFILLVSCFKLLNNSDELAQKVHKISGKLPRFITFPVLFMLFPYLLPNASYGMGTLLLIITAVLCAVFNAFIGRMKLIGADKAISKKVNAKMNIIQGMSLVVIAGLILFVFSFMSTNLVDTFFGGKWSEYVSSLALYTGKESPSQMFLIDALLMVAMIMILFATFPKYLGKNLQRFSMSSKRDSYIGLSLVCLLIVLIPLVLSNMAHGYTNFVDAKNGSFSLLALTPAQKTSLILSLVGLALALAAEIAIIVLKNVFDVNNCTVVAEEGETVEVANNTAAPVIEEMAIEDASKENPKE